MFNMKCQKCKAEVFVPKMKSTYLDGNKQQVATICPVCGTPLKKTKLYWVVLICLMVFVTIYLKYIN